MKVKRFMSVILVTNFLIGMTIHFGMVIMLQILTEVILLCIFVQKNVKKNIRVILTAMLSKVTYNVSRLKNVAKTQHQAFTNITKTLDLKTKLTNTNQTSNYARYRNRAKPML